MVMPKEVMSAKKYLGIVSETMRECIDKETNTLTIQGDLANEIADTLQNISEELVR